MRGRQQHARGSHRVKEARERFRVARGRFGEIARRRLAEKYRQQRAGAYDRAAGKRPPQAVFEPRRRRLESFVGGRRQLLE